MLIISELFPKVQELQAARHKSNPTAAIIDLLRSINLSNVLPPAPAPTPRRFIVSTFPLPKNVLLIICGSGLMRPLSG